MATTTSPLGRDVKLAGAPIRMCEMISTLEAPVHVARCALAGAKEISKRLLEGGVYTTVRWSYLFIAPPLCITEEELREGLQVIDRVLDYADSLAE